MSSADPERFDERWLSLREPVDANARSVGLLDPLRAYLLRRDAVPPAGGGARPQEQPLGQDRATLPGSASRDGTPMTPGIDVLDIGSGTGSTTRWLAPKLPGPQRWTLLDHDPALLAYARERCVGLCDTAGATVDIDTWAADLTDLTGADVTAADLVTASALLDLLTRAEIDGLAAVCVASGCAALMTLSVAGQVELDPPDPLDAVVAAAFNAHQQRGTAGRRPLGPRATEVAAAAFARHGYDVRIAPSPWCLGPESPALTRSWLDGWLSAAVAQDRGLAADLARYRARRDAQIRSGQLRVQVHHHDLLAVPPVMRR